MSDEKREQLIGTGQLEPDGSRHPSPPFGVPTPEQEEAWERAKREWPLRAAELAQIARDEAMTAAEVIAWLQAVPADTPVAFDDADYGTVYARGIALTDEGAIFGPEESSG